MELSPKLRKFLDKLGVNTTRLQWKLYEREKQREEQALMRDDEDQGSAKSSRLPSSLRWMRYQHKFCPKCDSLVDRSEKICPSCGASLPSAALYKITRAIGLVVPEGSAVTTMGFIVVILGMYLVSVLVQGLSAIMRPKTDLLIAFGMQYTVLISHGEYWRMLGFGLLHAGLMHIGFNTMALSQVGPSIEREIGAKRMLVLITLTQIASAVMVQLWWGGTIYEWTHGAQGQLIGGAVGASGWLFGLLGFGIAYYHRGGRNSLDIRNFYIKWAAYGFFFGLIFHFNNAAHLGGLLGGVALGLTADLTRARRTAWTNLWDWLAWPSLCLWLVTLAMMIRSIAKYIQ